MELKGKLHLGKLLIIMIAFTYVTLMINYTKGVNLYWHLYAVPLILSAVTYDVIGGLVASVLSAISIGWWLYYFDLFTTNPEQARIEIPLGVALYIGMGIAIGILSGKQRKQKEMLEGLSVHDRLTGMYNYGFFLDKMEHEKKRADRYKHDLSMIIFDLDHFKHFNDTYGHEQGNKVLKTLAKIIKANIRNIDTAARYGGEEFVVILPMANEENTFTVAERVRNAVAKEDFEGNTSEPIVKVTISGGICSYPIYCQNTMELVYKADEALYKAKDDGRNRIYKYSMIK